MLKIDTRGMSCPQPVLMTKKMIDEKTLSVEILVDTHAARNNVERFLKNAGFNTIAVVSQDDDMLIQAKR